MDVFLILAVLMIVPAGIVAVGLWAMVTEPFISGIPAVDYWLDERRARKLRERSAGQ